MTSHSLWGLYQQRIDTQVAPPCLHERQFAHAPCLWRMATVRFTPAFEQTNRLHTFILLKNTEKLGIENDFLYCILALYTGYKRYK